jgi:selenocysteine-specific elongation factor
MKHLIMGTAGHVDHGKTALVKALTDFDCDTHKEEKRRGITINLGFTYLQLTDEERIGIVDVPGHSDFIHTMVGGSSGVDFVLFVIAADSGVMPQTREHLRIMDVLGIKKGIIVMTKVDLVEDELLELAKEEIQELIQGTFLEEAQIVPVSSHTKEGIEDLKKAIHEMTKIVEERPVQGLFRMFIDRIFSVAGFGTVVNGSVMSGELKEGQAVYLLPGERKPLRIRRMERYGEQVSIVKAGDRASVNLVGLERNDFQRGMVISDKNLQQTTMVDVNLKIFEYSPKLSLWSHVIFHVGTYESQARIHLIDKDDLSGGEAAIAQIHLEKPCILRQGDKFVIRNTSSDCTLGGGEIIDSAPLHHRRRPTDLVDKIKNLAEGDLQELIALEVRKRYEAVYLEEISNVLNIDVDELKKAIENGLSEDILHYASKERVVLIVRKKEELLRKRIVESIAAFHRKNTINPKGLIFDELLGRFGLKKATAGELLLELVLKKFEDDCVLKRVAHTWAMNDHNVQISSTMKSNITWLSSYLERCAMKTPLMSELLPLSKSRGIDEIELKQLLKYLIGNNDIYCVDGNYIHAKIVDGSRETLLDELCSRGEGMTVSQFRDLIGGNRKICLLLISLFDSEEVTLRVGDLRVVTEKGRAFCVKA